LKQNNKYFEDKTSLEKSISAINEIRSTQKSEINKYIEDNQKLVKLAQDNERTIKTLELEKSSLTSKNEEINFEFKNLLSKLRLKEESLTFTIRQLDDLKLINMKNVNTLKDNELHIDNLRNEISNLNQFLQKEKSLRNEGDNNLERLQNNLSDRQKEIERLIRELDNSQRNGNKLSDEKYLLESESQKLKNHISILYDQNEKVNFLSYEIFIFIFIYF
jgi:hypothetical protein